MNLKVKETLAKLLTWGATKKYATVSSGFSGEVAYIHVGRTCVFSGYVDTTGALTNGQLLATGLPAYHNGYGNAMIWSTNNNSASENIPLVLQSSGNLTVRGAQSSSNRSLRFTGAYLTSALGGVIHNLFYRLSHTPERGCVA